MALILNIETSGTVCSVCLARDGQEMAYRSDATTNSHARVLTIFIEELLKSSHTTWNDVDAIAVSSGPGSYTGLRIGVSVAKGLCYALNKPLIAVSTLQALAHEIRRQAKSATACYMPVIDARRMDMYTALYNAEEKEIWAPYFVTIDEELQQKLSTQSEVWIGGNATEKCQHFFTLPLINFTHKIDVDARLLTTIAEKKFTEQAFEDIAYYEPFYLKEFGNK